MKAPASFRDSLARLQMSRRKTQAIRQAYMEALVIAVKYYGDVLIGEHFTFGNQSRMGWPDLKEKYAERKLRTVGIQPMLVSSGALKNSIVGKYSEPKVNRARYTVTLEFPKALGYGEYLANGDKPLAGPRPWEEPTEADRVKIEAKLQEEFSRRLKGLPGGRTMRKTK